MHARNRRTGRQRRALTLAELNAVVAIIGVVGLVVVPGLAGSGGSMLSAAARVIASDLQYAQSLSLTQSATHKVEFDTAANEYRVFSVASDGSEVLLRHPWHEQQRFGGLFKVRFDEHTPYGGVFITSSDFGGAAWVQFGPLGEPHSAGYVELAAGDRKVRVHVRAATGTVKVTADYRG